ncbi:Type III restriction enzyme, res subunit, partial [Streptomyces sp. Ncost-T10-10d]
RSFVPPEGARATGVSATGSGKTITAAASTLECFPEGRVLVMVPTLDLIVQSAQAWRQVGHRAPMVAVCSVDRDRMAGLARQFPAGAVDRRRSPLLRPRRHGRGPRRAAGEARHGPRIHLSPPDFLRRPRAIVGSPGATTAQGLSSSSSGDSGSTTAVRRVGAAGSAATSCSPPWRPQCPVGRPGAVGLRDQRTHRHQRRGRAHVMGMNSGRVRAEWAGRPSAEGMALRLRSMSLRRSRA